MGIESNYLGRPVRCISNVKQLSLGLAMYTDDHDGRYPPDRPFSTSVALTPDAERPDGWLQPYTKSEALWACGADPKFVDRLHRTRPNAWRLSPSCYAWNARLAEKLAEDVESPGSVLAIFDTAPRHNGGRNVSFADGRTKWIQESAFGEYEVDAR